MTLPTSSLPIQVAASLYQQGLTLGERSGEGFASALPSAGEESLTDFGPKIVSYLNVQERTNLKLVCKAASRDKVYKGLPRNQGMGLVQKISEGTGTNIPKALGPLISSFLSFKENTSNRRIAKACSTDVVARVQEKQVVEQAASMQRHIDTHLRAILTTSAQQFQTYRLSRSLLSGVTRLVTATRGEEAGRIVSARLRRGISNVVAERIQQNVPDRQAAAPGDPDGYRAARVCSGGFISGADSPHQISK